VPAASAANSQLLAQVHGDFPGPCPMTIFASTILLRVEVVEVETAVESQHNSLRVIFS